MKKHIVLLSLIIALAMANQAQNVAINSDGSTPDASAMLDVQSTTSGFLVPRMTYVQRAAIASPATGLLVYQINESAGYYYYNGTSWVQFGQASEATQWTTSGSNIYYNSGNVGIGTTVPYSKLEVHDKIIAGNGTSTDGMIVLEGRYSQVSDDAVNTFGTMYSSGAWLLGYGMRPKSGSYGHVSSCDNSGFERVGFELSNTFAKFFYAPGQTTTTGSDISDLSAPFYFDLDDGRLGIGTTSPQGLLHLNSASTGVDGKTIINSPSNSYGQLQVANPSGDESSITFIPQVTAFGTAPTSTNGDGAIWSIGPNIYNIGSTVFGIGNKANSSVINMSQTGMIESYSSDPAPLRLYNTGAGGKYWKIGPEGSNNTFVIYDQNNYGVYISNNTSSWQSNSDIRLKENIRPITNALEGVLNLKGVRYNFIGSDNTEIGVIAQDFKGQFPELLSERNGYLGVAYSRIGPILIEAIKEQQVTIEEQQKQIDELKQTVAGLTKMFETALNK